MPVAAVEAPIQVDHTQVINYTSVMALGGTKVKTSRFPARYDRNV
jgi:hypothetical protein